MEKLMEIWLAGVLLQEIGYPIMEMKNSFCSPVTFKDVPFRYLLVLRTHGRPKRTTTYDASWVFYG